MNFYYVFMYIKTREIKPKAFVGVGLTQLAHDVRTTLYGR